MASNREADLEARLAELAAEVRRLNARGHALEVFLLKLAERVMGDGKELAEFTGDYHGLVVEEM